MSNPLSSITILAHFHSWINLNTIEIHFIEPLQKENIFTKENWKKFRPLINYYRQSGWILFDNKEGWELGKLHPLFSFRLRQLLNAHTETKIAIETAFEKYYNTIGFHLFQQIDNPKQKEQKEGIVLTQIEYDNLMHAVWLLLKKQKSPINPFNTLQHYFRLKANKLGRLHLGNLVLNEMANWKFKDQQHTLLIEYIGMLDTLGETYSALNMLEESKEIHLLALERIESSDIDVKEFGYYFGGIYQNLGIVTNKQGELEDSLQYFKKSLAYYSTENNLFQIGNIQLNIGLIARQKQNYVEGRQYLLEAQNKFEKLNQQHSIAQVWLNLGVLEDEQRNHDASIIYYQKALIIFEVYQDKHSIAQVEQNLGVIAGTRRQKEESLKHFQKALALFIELEDGYYQGICYRNMAITKMLFEEYEESEEYLLKALGLFISYKDEATIQLILQDMQRLSETTKNYWILKQAMKLLLKEFSVEKMKTLMPNSTSSHR